MVEYEAVMTRAQHLVASKLSAEDVGILLDAVASVGEPVRPVFLWRPSLRDADDDMVLEVAVNGQADAIVTFNRRDFRPATERFGIEVLLPGAAIERLGGISCYRGAGVYATEALVWPMTRSTVTASRCSTRQRDNPPINASLSVEDYSRLDVATS